MKHLLFLIVLFASLAAAQADPQLTSWFTTNSGKYARIYQSTANETAGTTSTTWTRGSGTQSSPAYADVNEINYSPSWVHIRTTGLASHIMGPWYLDSAKTQNFPNFPSNTATIYRIPRAPAIPTSKTLTGLGSTGRMVNGVSMYDSRDAFSYKNSSATDATPVNGLTGDGIWNRDGYFNEGVTFDPGLAHQAGNNYHYHAHPIALRYQLGDHVDYNATTNRYTETAAAVTAHSPIVAWAADGLPVYGPYGYSSPMNAASGVRRMVSGFTKRDGTNGTVAITVRQVLPLWAQRVQGRTTLTSAQYGPALNTTYALGHYIEDFDYRGDLAGQTLGTNFDLNEQNVRFCVTPEFPSGTWAYFTPINSDGTPQFPYTTGRAYYGDPTGGLTTATVMNADTPLTQQFLGGANKALAIGTPAVTGTSVTLTWSAVEGGTYSVDASQNQSTWTSKATGLVSTGTSKSSTYTALGTSGTEYGRVNRTALATYDTNGQTAATVAQSTTASYSLGSANVAPTLTTISTLTGATEDTAFTISYATLLAASNAGDANGDAISFRIEAVSTGTLTKGGVAVTAGTTLLSSGGSLVWTPALNANGTLAAFTVKAWDGALASGTAVQVNVAASVAANVATWSGGAGTGAWGTAANWISGVVPDSIDSVSFTGSAPLGISLGANRTVASLTFSGNSGCTLSGNTLSLPGIAVASPSSGTVAHSIGSAVSFTGAATAGIATNSTLTLGGGASGSTLDLTGPGGLIFTGSAAFSSDVTINSGTLTVSNGAAFSCVNLSVPGGSVLITGTGTSLTATTSMVSANTQSITISAGASATTPVANNVDITLDNGTLNLTSGQTSNSRVIAGSNGGTVNIGGNNVGTNKAWTCTGTLTKTGTGTLNKSNNWLGSGKFVIAQGTVSNRSANFSDTMSVDVSTGATLDLNFSGTDTVGAFYINGLQQSSGTWGSLTSSATHKTSLITGTGLLSVSGLQTFASWAAVNGLSGAAAAFTADPNGDGISNGLAYVLGGNPLADSAGVLPAATVGGGYLTLGFWRNVDSGSVTALTVEYSGDLVTWSSATIGAASSTDANGVIITVTSGGTGYDAVTVAVPVGTREKLFMHLKVTQ